jgi:DNA processing protein
MSSLSSLVHSSHRETSNETSTQILSPDLPGYPKSLMHLAKPPSPLYFRGNPASLNWRLRVSVVGTRKASAWGLQLARQVGRFLSQNDIAVVSGLARGVDMWAHLGSLESPRSKPVAVIGSGLSNCYPPEHQQLMTKIGQVGVAISEYPDGSPPLAFHFPQRNRIIAALSHLLILIEAPVKSGALITVQQALDLGREVMVVPGNFGQDNCSGNLELLRQGATPLCDLEDILTTLDTVADRQFDRPSVTQPLPEPATKSLNELNSLERQIWDSISQQGCVEIETLSRALGSSSQTIMNCLVGLELKNIIQRKGSNWHLTE